jgi:GNAT superfamily N-acetyltransferase
VDAVTIRKARRSDSSQFVALLKALADFERLEPPDKGAEERILTDIFEKRRLGLLVAALKKTLVGYALYYFSYSSFLARPTLYLEDIFVLEGHRGEGVGRALFLRCVREAVSRGCGRMEWSVLRWNKKAIGFYQALGARRLDEWYWYRLDAPGLERLARDGRPPKT